jgi:hypothetical protein
MNSAGKGLKPSKNAHAFVAAALREKKPWSISSGNTE